MQTAIFGRYAMGDGDASAWVPGAEVELDPYDGFFDQALDATEEGEELSFILDQGQLNASGAMKGHWRNLRQTLGQAAFVTGTYIAKGYRLRITRMEPFDLVIGQQLPMPGFDWVQRLHQIFGDLPSTVMGQPYRYVANIALPTLSTVREAEQSGLAGEHMVRVENGRIAKELTFMTPHVFVERQPDGPGLRALALGSNDLGSCFRHDIDSADSYERLLKKAHQKDRMRSRAGARTWKHLLG